jgi:maltooligosyltrehalose trehalohydrolase
MTESLAGRLGATPLGDRGTRFLLWAPAASRVDVVLEQGRRVALDRLERGYHGGLLPDVRAGARYRISLDGTEPVPDPASAFQPDGLHGPSAVVDPSFPWTDASWRGVPLHDLVIYELHVGTYTEAGTFDALIPHLPRLRALGVTALELMPVAQFPGARNWGYDGALPFAVHDSYGGPAGLKRLVDACHAAGLAVLLDVVYNHLGPEGNHLPRFGPYFTDRYRTPWGAAINFDGADSDEVRRYFMENALRWIDEFHIDGLRLDAVHAIHDESARPFLQELAGAVAVTAAELERPAHLIAESDLNDVRVVEPADRHGLGMDAQWMDDFHHALHALLTGERDGYYEDYGDVAHLARAYARGFVYAGEFSAYRRRRYGSDASRIAAERFVVCIQNHDQVGNRAAGDRIASFVGFEAQKLAAAAVLLAPYTPLIFMGEEYGETRPFPYFVSHSDADLAAAVRRGRREEFAAFAWSGEIPDPCAEATFRSAVLDHDLSARPRSAALHGLYAELLRLRRQLPALGGTRRRRPHVAGVPEPPALLLRRSAAGAEALAGLNLSAGEVRLAVPYPGVWRRLLDTADVRWRGPGAASPPLLREGGELVLSGWAAALYERTD